MFYVLGLVKNLVDNGDDSISTNIKYQNMDDETINFKNTNVVPFFQFLDLRTNKLLDYDHEL